MPQPIKAVLFDMDGVLVDVSRSYRRAIEETVYHFSGRRIVAGTVQRYKNLGGYNDDWHLTSEIIQKAGITVPFARVVDEFQRRYRGEDWNGFIAHEPPLVDTLTLQKLCEGRIMGVVTGRPEAEARWTIQHRGWKQILPLVVGREKQEGRGKPDPFPLVRALGILAAVGRKVEPEECVYVGDTVDDMRAARGASMWAVGFAPPYLDAKEHTAILKEAGAHVVLTDLGELPALVEEGKFGRETESVAA
jgi:HAD superfamily phosphatase